MSHATGIKAGIYQQNELQNTTILPENRVSTFSQNYKLLTTFDSGKLVPLMSKQVLPGDIFEIDVKALIKQVSPVFPTMGQAKFDIFSFFVPNRLVWDDFRYFMGESKSAWVPSEEFVVPHIKADLQADQFFYNENDLASYLGLPLNKKLFKNENTYNRLKLNVYCQIWNDWFRDENLQDEILFSRESKDISVDNVIDETTTSFYSNLQYGKELAPVSKLPDYFTTCLPSPQKGSQVDLLSSFGKVPVVYGTPEDTASLVADLSQSDAVIGINDLRFSIALQQFRELNARGGTRYIEMVLSHFGVNSRDLRTQRAQYLGGLTRSILMTQVLQMTESSATDSVSTGLGAFGGMSNTYIESDQYEKILFTAEEHGYIMFVCCVRTEQIYSQGVDKDWNTRTLTDFYFPTFANIGEQPVYTSEIFFDENSKNETTIFGYNEAWSYLRWETNKLTGYFSPDSELSLLSFTYANNFKNAPVLNDDFIRQDKNNVAQTLKYQESHQYYGEFAFIIKVSRVLPVQSIPGLFRV